MYSTEVVDKMKRVVLAMIPLLIIIGICYLYLHKIPPLERVAIKNSDESNIIFNGNVIEELKDGKLSWRFTAVKISCNYEEGSAYLDAVTGMVYYGTEVVHIKAQHGKVNLKTHDIQLSSNVEATAPDRGMVFNASTIEYFAGDKHAVATGGVKFIDQSVTLTGDKAVTDAGMHEITVTGHAKVVKNPVALK